MEKEKLRNKNRKGFTLMELIVVMGIISVLAFITAPTFLAKIEDAKVSADKANAKSIAMAVKTEILEGKLVGATLIIDQSSDIVKIYFDGIPPKPQSISSDTFSASIAGNRVTVKINDKEFYPNYTK
ncbi:MAG: type II secretion system protein [Clostridium sp.]|uniref:type II secretion system protein n=1 Tax=Clostridium sp. TaxID=1506 RepID=UPI003026BA30